MDPRRGTGVQVAPLQVRRRPVGRRSLADNILERTRGNPGFWNFSERKKRSGSHGMFQYPAMMVPELQGALLDDLLATKPDTQVVYDPFVGSGTVLLESMYRGLDFHGCDINPLALLLCHVKAELPSIQETGRTLKRVSESAKASRATSELNFKNVDKWFKSEVQDHLWRLRDAIFDVPNARTRRFLWICLAETIRLVSNSRTSTFKLHVYPGAALNERRPNAIEMFDTVARRNAALAQVDRSRLRRAGHMVDGAYQGELRLLRGDVAEPWTAPRRADVLMTSPPYGDNKTTIPYGQHSYLALQWIGHNDLPGRFDASELLSSTSRIDAMSLGGSIRNADSHRKQLEELSPSLRTFLVHVEHKPALRKKVLAFTHDYGEAMKSIHGRLAPGATCFFTLGERRVGGHVLPLLAITQEFLNSLEHTELAVIDRVLPLSSKRMAGRNNLGATMAQEHVLVTEAPW